MYSGNPTENELTRRKMLVGGVSLAAAGAMVGMVEGCGGDGSTTILQGGGNTNTLIQGGNNPGPAPGPVAPAFVQPTSLRSAFGVLDTTLTVQLANNNVNNTAISTRTYNGGLVGPTLRVRPGDVLRVRVDNQLAGPSLPAKQADENIPHEFNTTNLHTHGLHVSPSGSSDNIFTEIAPGASFQYEYNIPSNHPPGTYYYHPHKHGSATVQIFSGMGGCLIVEGGLDAVPEIAAARDLVFLVGELNIVAGVVPNWTTLPNAFASGDSTFIVNGQFQPLLQAFRGEVIRLRVMNTSPRADVNFAIAGHMLNIIALDGIALPAVRTNVPSIALPPAGRADVLVRCSDVPGDYLMQKLAQAPFGLINLATLRILNTAVTMNLPAALPPVPLADITAGEIVNNRTITFENGGAGATDDAGPAGFSPPNFGIGLGVAGSRLHFDSANPAEFITPTVNTAEQWTLRNNGTVPHPFHIHINPFQVLSVNGVALPQPEWHDTFQLPPGQDVIIRQRFENFTGMFVLHCHILIHEDVGMMRVVNVIP